MNTPTSTRPLADTAALIGDVITQSAQIYLDLLSSLSSSDTTSFVSRMQEQMQKLMPASLTTSPLALLMPRSQTSAGCSCHIPPPCWMPQPLGEVVSHLCPGGAATLQLRITNCGEARRQITFEATGKLAGVKFTPPQLSLGPLERDTAVASVTLPPEAKAGEEHEVLVWVRGCKTHFLRWTLKVTARGACCCHEIEVNDCPDLVHHWYDHFYCRRPCPTQRD